MKIELKHQIWIGVFLSVLCTDLSAQNSGPVGKSVKQDEIKKEGLAAEPGTYQFVVIPVEKGDPFTNDYLVMIEK